MLCISQFEISVGTSAKSNQSQCRRKYSTPIQLLCHLKKSAAEAFMRNIGIEMETKCNQNEMKEGKSEIKTQPNMDSKLKRTMP